MKVWWITLASTFLICFLANGMGRWKITKNGEMWRANIILSILACVILIAVAGLRTGIGDTPAYIEGFNKIPSTWNSGINQLKNSNGKDRGFTLFSLFIKVFISQNEQFFLICCSAVTIGLIFITFYKNIEMLEMAVFLFITSGCYLVTMNGIRQYIVTAVMFFAFPWIHERKWYLYIPLAVIMSTVHQSCLIFILLYFIVDKKGWGHMTYMILIVGAGLYLTYPVTGPMIASILQESQYSDYSGVIASTGAGANIIRVIVMSVPIVFSYLGRKYDSIRRRKYYNIIINMSVINLAFILLATRYWIYARFNMYFMVYMIILLIWCIEDLFDERNRKLMYFLCLALYTVYYWYEMVMSLGQTYSSKYINF